MRTKHYKSREEMRDAIAREIELLNIEIDRLRLVVSTSVAPSMTVSSTPTPSTGNQTPVVNVQQLAMN